MNMKEAVGVASALVSVISERESEKKREEEALLRAARKRERKVRRATRIKTLKQNHVPGNGGHHCKSCGARWDQASKECSV